MTKRLLCGLAILYAYTITTAFVNTKKEGSPAAGVNIVILDAGHGGYKPGAKGWNGAWEKDITLGVALKLEKEINKLIPGLTIYQTRTDDSHVDNRWRADFANEKKGDVFISIHSNSVPGAIYKREIVDSVEKMRIVKSGGRRDTMYEMVPVYENVKYPKNAKGLETYVWEPGHNQIKVDAARKAEKTAAEAENEEILNDPNYKEKYGGGMDITTPEFGLKASLRTKKYFRRSVVLANYVQDEGAAIGRNDRNVKQRGEGIWVLQATNMPSILVETGYISNPEEEAYLVSDSGQQEMAELIARALKRYKDELEAASRQNTNAEQQDQQPPAAPAGNNGNNDNAGQQPADIYVLHEEEFNL